LRFSSSRNVAVMPTGKANEPIPPKGTRGAPWDERRFIGVWRPDARAGEIDACVAATKEAVREAPTDRPGEPSSD